MLRSAWCLAFLLPGTASFASDWPQWQGPDRNGVSKETGLLKEWPTDGPALAWKAKALGGGDSAPSIAKGKIYGMGAREGEEVVWCLSEKDGSELWSAKLGAQVQQRMPQSKEGPGCSPTIDNDRLYVIGMGGDLVCFQVNDGKELWRVNFTKDFGGRTPPWSFRESPLVDGDQVLCTPGGPEAALVALDKKTGKTIWKSKVPGSRGAAYSSVIAIDAAGKHQYVVYSQGNLAGVDATDGKNLWTYDKPASRMGIRALFKQL